MNSRFYNRIDRTRLFAETAKNTFEQSSNIRFGDKFLNDLKIIINEKRSTYNVVSNSVLTPTEFLLKKIGNYETKSIIAYTLLKKLGFNFAIIIRKVISNQGFFKHTMLSIVNINL